MLMELLGSLAKAILEGLLLVATVYGATTVIFAGVCLYYGLPLVLALLPGVVTVGVALALKSHSIFD